MHTVRLNEHDANQGAQSSGEFLGMTGNSGWYLLGSGGATVLMVVFLWGILGVSLLLCLLAGAILCTLSLLYVFTLKNNQPQHYDSDFFESALIEARLLELRFGPRPRRAANPFSGEPSLAVGSRNVARDAFPTRATVRSAAPARGARPAEPVVQSAATPEAAAKPGETVSRKDYEALEERLHSTEEQLEVALEVEREEN